MSKRKLTLSVDEAVIHKAKRFSDRHDTTVSQLVTDFLSSLEDAEEPATPVVSSLRGVLPRDVTREQYREHLRKKHGR